MSQEEIREKNVRLVANVALDKFIEDGLLERNPFSDVIQPYIIVRR